MKEKKVFLKFIAAMVAVIMAMTMMTVSVVADEDDDDAGAVATVTVVDTTAAPGELVTVTLRLDIEDDEALGQLRIAMVYDAEVLTLQTTEIDDGMYWADIDLVAGGPFDDIIGSAVGATFGMQAMTVVGRNTSASGNMATVSFMVAEDAEGETEVSVAVEQAIRWGGTFLAPTMLHQEVDVVAGTVTIEDDGGAIDFDPGPPLATPAIGWRVEDGAVTGLFVDGDPDAEVAVGDIVSWVGGNVGLVVNLSGPYTIYPLTGTPARWLWAGTGWRYWTGETIATAPTTAVEHRVGNVPTGALVIGAGNYVFNNRGWLDADGASNIWGLFVPFTGVDVVRATQLNAAGHGSARFNPTPGLVAGNEYTLSFWILAREGAHENSIMTQWSHHPASVCDVANWCAPDNAQDSTCDDSGRPVVIDQWTLVSIPFIAPPQNNTTIQFVMSGGGPNDVFYIHQVAITPAGGTPRVTAPAGITAHWGPAEFTVTVVPAPAS